jgi:hypothetical protein
VEQVGYHKRTGTTRTQSCCGSVAVVGDGQTGALFALNGAIWRDRSVTLRHSGPFIHLVHSRYNKDRTVSKKNSFSPQDAM